MRTEIMFAGFGGQGIVKAALLLAVAAGLHQKLEIAQTQSYGPEARGGACKAEVVISDSEIAYIKTSSLDALVVMSKPALDKYVGRMKPGKTWLIVDKTMVDSWSWEIDKVVSLPATDMAEKVLGKSLYANIIMLGALGALTGAVSLEALDRALAGNVPVKTLEANQRALRIGWEAVEELPGDPV